MRQRSEMSMSSVDGERVADANVEAQLDEFVRKHFRIDPSDPIFDRDADLFEEGYVDSVGVMELLGFLDEQFGVEIPDDDLLSDEFSTIAGMAAIVQRVISGSRWALAGSLTA